MGRVVSMDDRNIWDMETDEERDEYCRKHSGMSYEELLKEWETNPIYEQEYKKLFRSK